MDDLEQFIISHRASFNKELPSQKVWAGINSSLDEEELRKALLLSEQEKLRPSARVWEEIDAALEQEGKGLPQEKKQAKQVKMVPASRLWQLAASFAILLVSTLWLQHYLQTNSQSNEILAEQESQKSLDLADAAPELMEAEQYYMSVIQKHQTSLKDYDASKYNVDMKDFEEDMKHLDSVYQAMKEDLAIQPDNERVVNAMVENLQLRMNILARQLQLMQQLKHPLIVKTE